MVHTRRGHVARGRDAARIVVDEGKQKTEKPDLRQNSKLAKKTKVSTSIRSEHRLRSLVQQIIQRAVRRRVRSSLADVRDQTCADCALAPLSTTYFKI